MDNSPADVSTGGFIDLYGYDEAAFGWLFVGWIPRSWMGEDAFRLTGTFAGGSLTAKAAAVFYERADVAPAGVGLVLFAESEQCPKGELLLLEVGGDGSGHQIPVSERAAARLNASRIRGHVDGLLRLGKILGGSRPLSSVLTRLLGEHTENGKEQGPEPGTRQPPAGHAAQASGPRRRPVAPAAGAIGSGEFDEATYLRDNPGVAQAIANGSIPNALFHYRLFAKKAATGSKSAAPVTTATRIPSATPRSFGPANIDALILSATGTLFVIGWADDRSSPIRRISVEFDTGAVAESAGEHLVRFRRADAEEVLGLAVGCHLGFCGLFTLRGLSGDAAAKPRLIRLLGIDGSTAEFPVTARTVSDIELRDVALGYLAGLDFAGNKQVELFYALDPEFGNALIRLNGAITRSIVGAAACERFETGSKRFKGSVVVCLYGKPEFQFVQNALFSAGASAEDYEFIYVSNSPELIEGLCKTARISHRIYGLSVSVVMLPGNAGFGAANNAAARYARSRRLLIVNPDVLPFDNSWAARHNDLVSSLPGERTKLFGPRLFYADGSLMHAGMYVDRDWGVSVSGMEIRRRAMLRVEHYGKGAPRAAMEFAGSRPVTAVSGAFISIDRPWFEQLGGFAEDYIFGHYEDADLCLRSIGQGVVPWVHDLELWHLEGKGSTRLPHHEGASVVNRWLFTREWHERLASELVGRTAPPVASPPRMPRKQTVAEPVLAGIAS